MTLSKVTKNCQKIISFFRPVKLFYYNPKEIKNFGDQLNIPLLGKLSRRRIIESSSGTASIVCIGSLLEQFLTTRYDGNKKEKNNLTVWGSGFIAPQGEHPVPQFNEFNSFSRETVIKAVRGKLTYNRLSSMDGVNLDKCVLGDPGLLSYLLVDSKKTNKKYSVGIVPHYVDKNNILINILKDKLSSSIVINVENSPLEFLNKIQSCEVIISSAMHGLIASDSLGIPNIRMKISEKITGGDYKFNDYYSVFDVSHRCLKHSDIMNITNNDIKNIMNEYEIKQCKVRKIASDLIRSFPL